VNKRETRAVEKQRMALEASSSKKAKRKITDRVPLVETGETKKALKKLEIKQVYQRRVTRSSTAQYLSSLSTRIIPKGLLQTQGKDRVDEQSVEIHQAKEEESVETHRLQEIQQEQDLTE